MVDGLTFFIILVVLVLIHEFGHYIAAKRNGVYVEEFGFGFPPRVIGKKIGETLYSLNLLPLGGFVKLYGEEYHEKSPHSTTPQIPAHKAFVNKKPWQKAIIIVAGVIMNFLLGWVLISYLFTAGTPRPAGISVDSVQENSPAAVAGLQAGDTLLSLTKNGDVIDLVTTIDLIQTAKRHAGSPLMVTVRRPTGEFTYEMTPRLNPPKGQGALGIVIRQNVEIKKYPWYKAPFYGLYEAANMTRQIFVEIIRIPYQLVTQRKTDAEFAGPIGIAKVVGEARKYGIQALLEITALLSLNLAVLNIMPFPALDGGRLVFVVYEWITKKKPNANFEKYLNFAGIIVLLALSVVATISDISKL